jgi:membrane protein
VKEKIALRIPALTYFTLMSIVPIFAILFAIGKFFGLKKIIEEELIERFDSQKEMINQLIYFTNNFIEQAQTGAIAIIGILFLFYSLIKLFSHIENSLNLIFDANKRKIKNRFSLYVSNIFLISIFFVLFSYIKFYLIKYTEIKTFGFYENISIVLLKISTYLLIWILFTFLFIYIPNTKVRFKPAVVSAFLTSIIYQFVQYYYVYFQVGFTKYNAIYGSFAALPLFLIWIQISWYIFLYGACFTYKLQKVFIKKNKF